MPDCRGVGESRIYSKRAKKSPFAGFVPQSGITAPRSIGVILYLLNTKHCKKNRHSGIQVSEKRQKLGFFFYVCIPSCYWSFNNFLRLIGYSILSSLPNLKSLIIRPSSKSLDVLKVCLFNYLLARENEPA